MSFMKCHWHECSRPASSSIQQTQEAVSVTRYYCASHLVEKMREIVLENFEKEKLKEKLKHLGEKKDEPRK